MIDQIARHPDGGLSRNAERCDIAPLPLISRHLARLTDAEIAKTLAEHLNVGLAIAIGHTKVNVQKPAHFAAYFGAKSIGLMTDIDRQCTPRLAH